MKHLVQQVNGLMDKSPCAEVAGLPHDRSRVRSRFVTEQGPLDLRATVEAGVAQVSLHGELDLDRASAVADELGSLLEQDVTTVVVDVAGLTFLDSSGLRALLTAREKLEAGGATLELTNLSASVERVLDMTGTRSLLTRD
jgi:anti-anti-sigma factor